MKRICLHSKKTYLCTENYRGRKMKRLVIFDLDGTLLNTIADLGNSTNYALKRLGYPTHDIPSYCFRVGNGINKLFERALPESERTEINILKVRKFFMEYYNEHCADNTCPYPGISVLLDSLQERGVMMAVASNKYQEASRKLISHYFAHIPFVAVFGQRDGVERKPNPAVVLEIMNIAGVSANEVLYVGDSGVDMETALNAEVTACGVTWGFRPKSELQKFNPAYLVDSPEAILLLLDKENV